MTDRVYSLHELLLQIVSDREIQQLAKIFWKKCNLLGIQLTMLTAYHLQTDRQIEYVDQILEHYLRCYVDYDLEY